MSEVCRQVRVPTSLRNDPTSLSARWAGLLVALAAVGELLIGEVEPVAELLWPHGRHAAHVVARPRSLQVRVAPRRARRRVS
jgi:hypothetical protein